VHAGARARGLCWRAGRGLDSSRYHCRGDESGRDGWSAKKQILRQPVYNEQKQKVGIVDDLIIAPDTAVSFVIIGAGGFVGVGRHDVAIPVNQLKQENGKIVLPGATKEAIKALPKFEYAKK
jgi:hypothetical protein